MKIEVKAFEIWNYLEIREITSRFSGGEIKTSKVIGYSKMVDGLIPKRKLKENEFACSCSIPKNSSESKIINVIDDKNSY